MPPRLRGCRAPSDLYCPVKICHPIPPTPFPSGEGGVFYFILPGASPPAPLCLFRKRYCVPGFAIPRGAPSSVQLSVFFAGHASCSSCPLGRRSAARQAVPRPVQGGVARGEAPCKNKLRLSPFPGGEGGRGDGAKGLTDGRSNRGGGAQAPFRYRKPPGNPCRSRRGAGSQGAKPLTVPGSSHGSRRAEQTACRQSPRGQQRRREAE